MRRRTLLKSFIARASAFFVGTKEAKHVDVITANGTDEVKDLRSMVGLNHVMLGKQILDVCVCRDYIYVLLEGGQLWRAFKGGEYFGKPFSTWFIVRQFPAMVEKLEEQTTSWIVGVGKNNREKVNFGSYLIEEKRIK